MTRFQTLGHIDDLIVRLAPGQEVGVILKESHEKRSTVLVFVGFAKTKRRLVQPVLRVPTTISKDSHSFYVLLENLNAIVTAGETRSIPTYKESVSEKSMLQHSNHEKMLSSSTW
jgi:hypothetical protein